MDIFEFNVFAGYLAGYLTALMILLIPFRMIMGLVMKPIKGIFN